MQRVKRAAEAGLTPREEGERLVESEVDRLIRIGALNDERFAADKANALRRRGGSSAKIRAVLQSKSLRSDQIDAVVVPGEDAAAAATWARKRRLGPWRREPATPERRRSELAKLARAGFSYAVARRVVDAESEDDLAPR
jgi:regulatory protein